MTAQEYKTTAAGNAITINGCDSWKNYELAVNMSRNGAMSAGENSGLVLRFQSSTQYYLARINCVICTGNDYVLELVDFNSGDTVLTSVATTFEDATIYTLKASVDDDTLNAKFWKTSDAEPVDWDITATDISYTEDKIGLTTDIDDTVFDDLVVNPL